MHLQRRTLLRGATALCATGLIATRGVRAAMPRASFIDTHIHPIGGEMTDVAGVDSYNPANHPKIEQFILGQMEQAGVAMSLLSMGNDVGFKDAAKDPGGARKINEMLAKMASNHPGKLKFFACLPMPDMDACIKEIDYGMNVLGAIGVSLFTGFNEKWMGDPMYAPLFTELNRRKVAVKVHPRVAPCCNVKDFPSGLMELGNDTARAISRMLMTGSAEKYPDMHIIWSHAGGALLGQVQRYAGYIADDPKVAAAMPKGADYYLKRFYYDVAQAYHPATLSALKALVPISNIFFGTDLPHRTQLESREGLERSRVFTAEELKAIGDGSVRKLLKLA